MRAAAIIAMLMLLVACKTTQQRNADITSTGNACMAYVMDEHKAGRISTKTAEYGLAKCESDANAQAQLRYLTNQPR